MLKGDREMMRHKNPNRLADRIVFWLCLFIAMGLYTSAMYQYGFDNGAASCKPAAPIQMDLKRMSLRAEANFVRWWKARGT